MKKSAMPRAMRKPVPKTWTAWRREYEGWWRFLDEAAILNNRGAEHMLGEQIAYAKERLNILYRKPPKDAPRFRIRPIYKD